MKTYKAEFKTIHWYNGGKKESHRTIEIEARTLKSATNKAMKMESFGKSRRWMLLENISEIA